MRRADDAHVDGDFRSPSDALDHAFLKEAQQLCLQRGRQIPDLVQHQRAPVGSLDLADGLLALHR